MSLDNYNTEVFANTEEGRRKLEACMAHTCGIPDDEVIFRLIEDNNKRGYLDHCARMGAKVAAVASALAAQLDVQTPIEDEAPEADPHAGDDPHAGRTEYTEMFFHGLQTFTEAFDDLTRAVCSNINRTDLPPSLSEAIACSVTNHADVIASRMASWQQSQAMNAGLIYDAIVGHANAINRLANVIENAFDRPVRIETSTEAK